MPHMSILVSGLYIGLLFIVPRFGWHSDFGAVSVSWLIHDAANSHSIIVVQCSSGFHRKSHPIITSNHHRIGVLIRPTRTSKVSNESLHSATANNVGHHGISPSSDSDETALSMSCNVDRSSSKDEFNSPRTSPSMLTPRAI